MRIINEYKVQEDFYEVVGYHYFEKHPTLTKWLLKQVVKSKVVKDLCFKCVSEKPMFQMEGVKLGLCVEVPGGTPKRIHYEGDYDTKDADNGLLSFYKGTPLSLQSLRIPEVVLHLRCLKSEKPNIDFNRITYEDALTGSALRVQKALAMLEAGKAVSETGFINMPFYGELSLRFFVTEAAFAMEGSNQKNCVHYTYWDKFRRGEVLVGGIYFTDKPEESYVSFALSYSTLELVQIEGYHWSPAPPEVVGQLTTWLISNKKALLQAKATCSAAIHIHAQNKLKATRETVFRVNTSD